MRYLVRTQYSALLALALQASGCGATADEVESSGASAAPLTAAEAKTLGFEDVTAWTSSAGILEASAAHSQGSSALAIRNVGYAELTSAPVSTFAAVSDAVSIDVQVPAVPEWGFVQLLLSSPTLGLSNAFVGQASVQGLQPGGFHALHFPVSAALQTQLTQSYSDLQIKLVLNVPTAGTWVVDNFRFQNVDTPPPDCSDGSAYTLLLQDTASIDPATVETMRCAFHSVYPVLAARFNPDAPRSVTLRFGDFGPIASASGLHARISFQTKHITEHPEDTDAFVHELMHIVQWQYVNAPIWIVEGSADHVRDQYGLQNEKAGWSLPTAYSFGDHYTTSYRTTAAFLKWIDSTYRVGQPSVIEGLDDMLRVEAYDPAMWVTLTGHSVDALFREYSGNQFPIPPDEGVAVYQHIDYRGHPFVLGRGRYDRRDLQLRGIPDNWLSSIQVPEGYTVTAYINGGFTGRSVTLTADTPTLVGLDMNDKISSLIVR